jgi:acyl carrier protein
MRARPNRAPSQELMSENVSPLRRPAPEDDLTAEVAALIVEALNLEVASADIDPQQPLYGEGLGLDSIDILEVALVVSKQYGVQLRADSQENERIFGSLRQLVDYIAAHRTK